jgi:hypothetical protein
MFLFLICLKLEIKFLKVNFVEFYVNNNCFKEKFKFASFNNEKKLYKKILKTIIALSF